MRPGCEQFSQKCTLIVREAEWEAVEKKKNDHYKIKAWWKGNVAAANLLQILSFHSISERVHNATAILHPIYLTPLDTDNFQFFLSRICRSAILLPFRFLKLFHRIKFYYIQIHLNSMNIWDDTRKLKSEMKMIRCHFQWKSIDLNKWAENMKWWGKKNESEKNSMNRRISSSW